MTLRLRTILGGGMSVLLGGIFLIPVSAQARIGETRSQLDARYSEGKEVADQVLYDSDDYSLAVFFDSKGEATMEIYNHRKGGDGRRPVFLAEELDALLQQESGGQSWQRFNEGASTTWRRADNRVYARFRSDQQILLFLSASHAPIAGPPPVTVGDKEKIDKTEKADPNGHSVAPPSSALPTP